MNGNDSNLKINPIDAITDNSYIIHYKSLIPYHNHIHSIYISVGYSCVCWDTITEGHSNCIKYEVFYFLSFCDYWLCRKCAPI